MCPARRSAPWPQLVALSLIGSAVASCSADSGRFNEGFGSSPSYSSSSRSDVTGSIPQTAPPASHVDSRPLPSLASADNGASGGGRGMGSYQPGSEVTRSGAPPPPAAEMRPPARTASSAPAVTAPYVPPRGGLVAPSGTHVVAPGETLNSIARLYGKPVMVMGRANNIPPDTMVRVGERIVIPEMGEHPATVAPRAEAPVAAPTTVATIESPHSARLATPSAPVEADNPIKAEQAASAMPSFRWPVRGRIIAAF